MSGFFIVDFQLGALARLQLKSLGRWFYACCWFFVKESILDVVIDYNGVVDCLIAKRIFFLEMLLGV